MVKAAMSNILVPMKGLVTRKTHVKYESPISYGLKVIVKVQVSKCRSKGTRSKRLVLMERPCHKISRFRNFVRGHVISITCVKFHLNWAKGSSLLKINNIFYPMT